jgi:hypothetical protein
LGRELFKYAPDNINNTLWEENIRVDGYIGMVRPRGHMRKSIEKQGREGNIKHPKNYLIIRRANQL